MTETWRLIPNFPDYEVSSKGRVWSTRGPEGTFLETYTDKGGREVVKLLKGDWAQADTCLVDDLVAEVFG
jgi:hypothetical protein